MKQRVDGRVRPTRRRVLAWAGAGGAGLIAGCANANPSDNGGGNSTDDNSASEGNESGNTRFTVFDPTTSGTAHVDRHLNPFNPSESGCWHPGANVFDQPILYSKPTDELYPHIATSWEKSDETTLEVTFSDEWTWHNGDPVVAQDWATQLQLALEISRATADSGNRPHQVVESVEAVDDQLLRFHLHDSFTPKYVFQNWLNGSMGDNSRGIYTKHDDGQWSEWLEALRNTENGNAESILEEITTTAEPKLNSDAVGNGPFQISAVGDTETIMVPYEDHPHSDDINFSEYSLKLFAEANQPSQAYLSGQVNAAHRGFPLEEDLKDQLPDEHTLINEMRSSNKLFAFNCGHDVSRETPFDSTNVRKAVCHVFDRQQAQQLLQGVNRLFEWPPCRIPGEVLRDSSHPAVDWVSEFTSYGENDTERAAELLNIDGYSLEDGEWYDPDGERFEINIMNAAERADFQVLAQNLEEFGIAVEQEQVDQATFDERRQNGDYHLMPDASGADGVSTMWGTGLMLEWLPSILHYPTETEIPMPVGDPDGSSGTKTINLAEHIVEWHTTGDEQYHRELMWWWNQTIPEMEAMYEPNAGAYNGSNWSVEMPDEGIRDVLYAAPKMSDGAIRHNSE